MSVKKKIFAGFLVLIMMCGLSFANQAEAVNNLAFATNLLVNAITQLWGFRPYMQATDAQVWWRYPQTEVVFNRFMAAGNTYFFVASGDNNAADVDISVYDAQGVLVQQDTHTDKNAYLFFRANFSENHTIKVKLFSSYNGGPSHIAYVMGTAR